MINAEHQIAVDSAVKKITFKHYRTGEEITKLVSDIPHLNKNPNNHRVIYWSHDDDDFEDIIKSSIIKIEDVQSD